MSNFTSFGNTPGGGGQGGNGIITHKQIYEIGPDGKLRVIEVWAGEGEVGGVYEGFEAQRFLCQRCEMVWVVPGENAYSLGGKVLCRRCYKINRWIDALRPLWSIFYQPNP